MNVTTRRAHSARIIRLAVWGISLGVIGLILCKGEQNGGTSYKVTTQTGWIPINKNLWSLSFILVMAATGNIFLTICYLLVDVTKVWNGAPFIFPGKTTHKIKVRE